MIWRHKHDAMLMQKVGTFVRRGEREIEINENKTDSDTLRPFIELWTRRWSRYIIG